MTVTDRFLPFVLILWKRFKLFKVPKIVKIITFLSIVFLFLFHKFNFCSNLPKCGFRTIFNYKKLILLLIKWYSDKNLKANTSTIFKG